MSSRYVDNICGAVRKVIQNETCEEEASEENEGHSDNEEREDGVPHKRPCIGEDLPQLTRPSEYLRSRCPLCFGGRSTLAEGLVPNIALNLIFLTHVY